MKTIKQWVAEAQTLTSAEKDILIAYGESKFPMIFDERLESSFTTAMSGLFYWEKVFGGTRYWLNRIAQEEEAIKKSEEELAELLYDYSAE